MAERDIEMGAACGTEAIHSAWNGSELWCAHVQETQQQERADTSENRLQLTLTTASNNKHAHVQCIAAARSRENRNSCLIRRRPSIGGQDAPSTHASKKVTMAIRHAPGGLGNLKLNWSKTSKRKLTASQAQVNASHAQVKDKSSNNENKSSTIQTKVKHTSSQI